MSNNETQGILYIVATPIGNMGDITVRALDILKSVDVIYCEDTRTTGKLLRHFDISTKTKSYHAHSGSHKVSEIIELLHNGKTLALVSDAGTPGISDPGVLLVQEIRSLDTFHDIRIVCVPGASSLTGALSISGFPTHEFMFKGFIPHKKGRETFFNEIVDTACTVVCFESVHRIQKTIDALAQVIPERKIALVRELTKIYEEYVSGTPATVRDYFEHHQDKIRGEFVVIIAPKNML